MSTVTNAFIFKNRDGIKKLFAEVVEDSRYEVGNHLVTSEIINIDNDLVITKSGTKYKVIKFLSKDEFITYVHENYSKEKADYYLFYTNTIE